MPHFIELNNRVLANFSDEERRKIGIQTWPGGDRDSVHSAEVPYDNMAVGDPDPPEVHPDPDNEPADPRRSPSLPPIPPPAFVPIEDRYHELVLPQMFKINAGYFLIQLGATRNRDAVYDLIGRQPR